jgi:hypothetical protein
MLNGATGQPFKFKFTANVGNWRGYGYGDTKCEAFRAFARGVPKPERRRVIRGARFATVEAPLTIDGPHGYLHPVDLLRSEVSCMHWAARDPNFRWCRLSKLDVDDAVSDPAETSECGGRIEPR